MVDSTTLDEAALGNGESESSLQDKQPTVSVKKIPLGDLPNMNNMTEQKASETHVPDKEEVVTAEGVKVSSTKRPPSESPINSLHNPSTNVGNASGRLVYVRRKLDTEVGKNNSNEIARPIADDHQPGQFGPQEGGNQQEPKAVEAREQSSPASAPIPTAITATFSSAEPSGPPNLEASNNTLTVPSSDQKKMINRNWEERYLQLQMYLKKLDQMSLDDHFRELRSFSSAELSSYAVELEKRAIHLSLVEGKEIQRVRALNVLGKSFKVPEVPPVITKLS